MDTHTDKKEDKINQKSAEKMEEVKNDKEVKTAPEKTETTSTK